MTVHVFPQPELPSQHIGPRPGKTLRQEFEEFHARHPEVYRELVALARAAKARGARRLGIKALFEIVRWNRLMNTTDWAGFKLNNNLTSYYAREIMANEPDLAGIFTTRRLHVADGEAA